MISIEDLRAFPFIALERPDLSLSEVASWLSASGSAIEPAISIWDDNAAMSMVEEGIGLTVLPETVTRRVAFDVRVVPLTPTANRRVDLAWRDSTSPSPAAKTFLELMSPEADKR